MTVIETPINFPSSGMDFSALQFLQPQIIPPARKSLRDTLLENGGGSIDRTEVRRRAGQAMARNLHCLSLCVNTATEWVIIGGGPSINDSVKQIRQLQKRGVNIVSVNKSHDWLLENGIVPWGHILLDPNDWVANYVQRPRKDVRYFLASQCHPDTFDALEEFPVFLWHAGQEFPQGPEPNTYLLEHWRNTRWYCLPGKTTVGLRAMEVGHFLGANKFHLFGLDSSRKDGKLHGYEKDDNRPNPPNLGIRHNGQRYYFDTNADMARQQADFDKMLEELPEQIESGRIRPEFTVSVYGSGLLPFYAAKLGLHADPECNNDPTKVGGYAYANALAA